MPALNIKTIPVGPLQTNCYVLVCLDSNEAIVVDPGDEADLILRAVKDWRADVRYIVNTHGHFDHSLGIAAVKRGTQAKFAIHRLDAPMLRESGRSVAFFMVPEVEPVEVDWLLEDGDQIPLGNSTLQVLHTPGHTPGGICLLADKVLLSGDTLFNMGVGRTDFPGGDMAQLVTSIRTKLFSLPDDVVVYPGHGPATSIGQERRSNPFV